LIQRWLISGRLRRALRAIGLLPREFAPPEEANAPKEAKPLDEDAIYRQLGRFVVTFQVLENQLVQLAGFALDPARAGFQARLGPDRAGRRRLVDELWFGELVDETRRAVGDFLDQHRGEEPEFREQLEVLLDRCREIARYRNKLIHSAYVFLEGGGELVGIMRSNLIAGAGDHEVDLDQEMLTEESFEAEMAEVAEVAFEIGQCRLQLIHWYP
jgi:hypothetical protein